jgi:hypothetical protein
MARLTLVGTTGVRGVGIRAPSYVGLRILPDGECLGENRAERPPARCGIPEVLSVLLMVVLSLVEAGKTQQVARRKGLAKRLLHGGSVSPLKHALLAKKPTSRGDHKLTSQRGSRIEDSVSPVVGG